MNLRSTECSTTNAYGRLLVEYKKWCRGPGGKLIQWSHHCYEPCSRGEFEEFVSEYELKGKPLVFVIDKFGNKETNDENIFLRNLPSVHGFSVLVMGTTSRPLDLEKSRTVGGVLTNVLPVRFTRHELEDRMRVWERLYSGCWSNNSPLVL